MTFSFFCTTNLGSRSIFDDLPEMEEDCDEVLSWFFSEEERMLLTVCLELSI